MIVELHQNPDLVKQMVKKMRVESGEKHPVISDINLYIFYGARITFWMEGDRAISVNMTKIGKRKKNLWEPYANWYGAYTLPEYRRKGFAESLYAYVEQAAVDAGCRRVKSLAGSSAGLGLHMSLGHQCWGKTANDEVWVDSPLPGSEQLYAADQTPPRAPGQLMTTEQLKAILNEGLRYDKP